LILLRAFLFDPNWIKIELNFSNTEARGRKPALMASDLSDEPASSEPTRGSEANVSA
jgi:hypothetical protein